MEAEDECIGHVSSSNIGMARLGYGIWYRFLWCGVQFVKSATIGLWIVLNTEKL